jgi:hypothetical protein
MRADFHRLAKPSRVRVVSVQQGAFMETILAAFTNNVDVENGRVSTYGTGKETLNYTSMLTTAKFLSQIVLDENAPSDVFLKGELVTWDSLTAMISKAFNKPFSYSSKGSAKELKTFIESKQKSGANLYEYVSLQYELAMLDPRSIPASFMNSRYPTVTVESVPEYFSRTIK